MATARSPPPKGKGKGSKAEILQREKSTDVDDVEYLLTSTEQRVVSCGVELQSLGIKNIKDLHAFGWFSIPLKGTPTRIDSEVLRLQKYVTRKREEVARTKAATNKKDSPPATASRGYSTPFTSPNGSDQYYY